MVKIKPAQETILRELRTAKEKYDQELARIELRAKMEREQVRQSFSVRVRDAIDTGIPARQVAIKGLGYADVGSLKQFTQVPTSSAGTRFSVPVEPENNTGPITLAVIDDSVGLWEARRGDTKVVAFHMFPPIPWEKGSTHILSTRDLADIAERDEIFALLKEQYPDLEWDD